MSLRETSSRRFNAIAAYVDPFEKHHFNLNEDYGDYKVTVDNIYRDENTDNGHLSTRFSDKLCRVITRLFKQLDSNVSVALSCGNTVYTGTAGLAMLKMLNDEKFKYKSIALEKAFEQCLKAADECPVNDRISFLNGNAGIVAVAAVAHHKQGNEEKAKALLKKLTEFSKYCSKTGKDAPPDEVLYGRAGYLYALLYVRKHAPSDIVQDSLIKQVISEIIDSGVKSANATQSKTPLHYQWHGKEYLGAAHGYAGIIHVLLLARREKLMTPSTVRTYLMPAMDYILNTQLPSRNFPSSKESELTDRLVQWCHGAPGFMHLNTLASELLHKEYYGAKYSSVCEDLGEVIWYRGLLKKGYSLCHGVAGNGYTLLRYYQTTKDLKYLNRATVYAQWCFHYGEKQEHPPDRPFSLYEGLAGVIYYLIDILNFDESKFPGYDL